MIEYDRTIMTSLSKFGSSIMGTAETNCESWKHKKTSLYPKSSETRDAKIEPKKALRQNRLESSTIKQPYSKELSEEIYSFFKASEEQNFEDGMESEFSKSLPLLSKSMAMRQ